MMEWTDLHCRFFHRLLTRRTLPIVIYRNDRRGGDTPQAYRWRDAWSRRLSGAMAAARGQSRKVSARRLFLSRSSQPCAPCFWPSSELATLTTSPGRPLRQRRPRWTSIIMWPSTPPMADRRLNSRSIAPNTLHCAGDDRGFLPEAAVTCQVFEKPDRKSISISSGQRAARCRRSGNSRRSWPCGCPRPHGPSRTKGHRPSRRTPRRSRGR